MANETVVQIGVHFIHALPEPRDDDGWFGDKFGIGIGAEGAEIPKVWYPAERYFPAVADARRSAFSRGQTWLLDNL